MLLLLLSACSFGITGSPGSISTSCPARCRCGRPGTRWVSHLQPCSQHGSLKSTQQFIPLALNAKTFPTFNHISAVRIFNIPMIEGLAPPAGPPACVKATFLVLGSKKKHSIVLRFLPYHIDIITRHLFAALFQRSGHRDGSSAAAGKQSAAVEHARPQQPRPRLRRTRRRGAGVPVETPERR